MEVETSMSPIVGFALGLACEACENGICKTQAVGVELSLALAKGSVTLLLQVCRLLLSCSFLVEKVSFRNTKMTTFSSFVFSDSNPSY